MEVIHDVVIIGSGISGIAASWQLTKAGIEHIIIESRNRVGGRITQKELDGISIPMGASYIHGPNLHNPVAKLLQEWGWKTIDSHHEAVHYVVKDHGDVDQTILNQALEMVNDMMDSCASVARNSEFDISLEAAGQKFFESIRDRDPQVQEFLRWWLEQLSHIEGASLSQLSAKEFDSFEKDDDTLPAGGYLKVYQKIFE